MVGTLVRGCRSATSWCDLGLTLPGDLQFENLVLAISRKP